jgi:pimeloyl-[acyl-carrier protein] methyl ester esterase
MSKADAGAMASFWASMASQDFRAALRNIVTPMLVLHGAESPVYPDGATAFVVNAAPKAQRIVLPGAGHVPHLETPDAFFAHVEAFARAVRRADKIRGGAHP